MEGQLCSLTPSRGLDVWDDMGPHLASLKSSHHGQAPTESYPPASCWPELVRPARFLSSGAVPDPARSYLHATPFGRPASQPAFQVLPLPGLHLHLFPIIDGRCRGARLSRSALPRLEHDGIQTPMAKQNMRLAAVAQVIFTSSLYRTRRSLDWAKVASPICRGLRPVVPKIAHPHTIIPTVRGTVPPSTFPAHSMPEGRTE